MPISPDVLPTHAPPVAPLEKQGVDLTPAQQQLYHTIDQAIIDATPVLDEDEYAAATGCGTQLLGS